MPDLTCLCLNPLVVVADNVFDEGLAGNIIAMSQKAGLGRAAVALYGEGVEHESRTNDQAVIDQWSHPALTDLVTRISSLVRLPPENSEPLKVLHYQDGQKFDDHYDGYDPNGLNANFLTPCGQRLFTSLCYLNDNADGEGGETVFPKLKLSVRPAVGRVLVFSNTVPGTIEVHPHSMHTGTPVTVGEKWVASVWWREQAWHVPREYPEEEGPMHVI